jgi:predicted DNA-binding transcriptional regulator AlpA
MDKSLLIGFKELAQILGVSQRTLRRLIAKESIPKPVALPGGNRWSRVQIKTWVDNGCQKEPKPDNLCQCSRSVLQ